MSAFTLYGGRGSTNTNRVRLTLAEGGFTNYELVYLDLAKGEHKSKEHFSRHPWGKVPAITFPNGFTLYESHAICKYLSKKFSFPLLPSESDHEATALFDQAESVEMQYFSEPACRITYEKFVKHRFFGLPADEEVVANALKAVEEFLDVAEKILSVKEYMAGDEFTLVDIYYVPLVQRLFVCGFGDVFTARPAVRAWWERVSIRPAVQKTMAA
ncbi:glutathione s-transferase domain-containing [Fusarium longipes]|uniref:glutathione transferase n=1 Tax=Fusarium longipes TaxID=694270 RepID=A0A395SIZ0_9HYPO|nr:glutathione s-transferase domain-containing [Fusarium longipes]